MTEDLTLAEISTDVINSINTNFSQIEDAVNAKAEMDGNSVQRFNVADAVELTEAVNKRQLDATVSIINTDISDLETELVTKADKSYIDANLALKANTADIQTALENKANLNGNNAQVFNVADAATSTQAINKGQLDSAINTISTSITIIESEIASDGYRLPDYANAISKSWNTSYTAECDGELYLYSFCNNTQTSILINGISYIIFGTAGICAESGCFLRISKGDVYKFRSVNGGTGNIKFIPLKGES